jgi:hypothetical protein
MRQSGPIPAILRGVLEDVREGERGVGERGGEEKEETNDHDGDWRTEDVNNEEEEAF